MKIRSFSFDKYCTTICWNTVYTVQYCTLLYHYVPRTFLLLYFIYCTCGIRSTVVHRLRSPESGVYTYTRLTFTYSMQLGVYTVYAVRYLLLRHLHTGIPYSTYTVLLRTYRIPYSLQHHLVNTVHTQSTSYVPVLGN